MFWKIYSKKHTFKNLKKRFLYPLVASRFVLKNHQHIIHLLSTQKDFRLKVTPPLGGGTGDNNNYFHFIFDYLLPVYQISKHLKKNQKINLLVSADYKFNHYFDEIFPNEVNLIRSHNLKKEQDYTALLGMNSQYVTIDFNVLDDFKEHVISALKLNTLSENPKVILIERTLDNDGKKTSANKRSLINHRDIETLIKNKLSPSFDFINVQLEELTLEEQIILFDNASLVIAQHGAGLSNCLWMKPKTQLIELNNNYYCRHFLNLAKFKKINYTLFKLKKKHESVEIKKFDTDVLSHKSFKQFFSNHKQNPTTRYSSEIEKI